MVEFVPVGNYKVVLADNCSMALLGLHTENLVLVPELVEPVHLP